MKSKKGQSLPLNTIVIAAIVLIVLVVIVMIFTGGMGSFVKGLKKDCATDLRGICGNFKCDVPSTIPPNSIPITGTNCVGKTETIQVPTPSEVVKTDYCCIPPTQ